MKYPNIIEGRFIDRPNRFIAHILIDDFVTICHVKNTGRCRELLLPGAKVWVQAASNTERKTKYDLIAVESNGRVVNIDSQAPNTVAGEWLSRGGLGFIPTVLRAESRFERSRFDFYLEDNGKPAYLEVKGVTLFRDGIALFPDAPTERGTKHIRELIRVKQTGMNAYILFVIQSEGLHQFRPYTERDPQFAKALVEAADAGVSVLARECYCSPNELHITETVSVSLSSL